jgi:hypothetical protein
LRLRQIQVDRSIFGKTVEIHISDLSKNSS